LLVLSPRLQHSTSTQSSIGPSTIPAAAEKP
jgi:hypothetical protein